MTVAQYARFAAIMAGFVGLGVELAAERLLAPSFGTTLDLWSIIIGLTFAALSLGYSLGGRIVDRDPSHRFMSICLLVAGAWSVGIAFLGRPIAEAIQELTFDFGGVTLGIFLSVLILITVPPFVLGMVTPAAIRLTVAGIGQSGSSAGTIFALSTIGSLVGTFLPVIILIPFIGVRYTFILVGLVGLIAGAIGLLPFVRDGESPAQAEDEAAVLTPNEALD